MPSYILLYKGHSLISRELENYLLSKNIASSNSMRYRSEDNCQVERYIDVILKSISLILRIKSLHNKQKTTGNKFCVLTVRPMSVFSKFQRYTSHGNSLSSWLMKPGPVLLRQSLRTSKSDS